MSIQRQYNEAWERPEWIYAQVLDCEKYMETPEIKELFDGGLATRKQYYDAMKKKFPVFYKRYEKIFMRCVEKRLTKRLLAMLLVERKKIDTGEKSFVEANREVIDASTQLAVRSFPEKLKEDVLQTYKELADQHDANIKEGIKQAILANEQVPIAVKEYSEEVNQSVTESLKQTNEKATIDEFREALVKANIITTRKVELSTNSENN
jgi:hypothetical protein